MILIRATRSAQSFWRAASSNNTNNTKRDSSVEGRKVFGASYSHADVLNFDSLCVPCPSSLTHSHHHHHHALLILPLEQSHHPRGHAHHRITKTPLDLPLGLLTAMPHHPVGACQPSSATPVASGPLLNVPTRMPSLLTRMKTSLACPV